MAAQRKYPEELGEHAVKMVLEVRERKGKGDGEVSRVARQRDRRHSRQMTPRPISGFRMSVSCVNTGTSQIMTRDIQMQPKLAHICGRPCLLSRIRGLLRHPNAASPPLPRTE
jgi:hypothetical protein